MKTNHSYWINKYTVSRILLKFPSCKEILYNRHDFHNTIVKLNTVDFSKIKFNTSFKDKKWYNFMGQVKRRKWY